MNPDYDPQFATFDPKDCGQAMVQAVEQLAERTGRSFQEFVHIPLEELGRQVEDYYGDDLPEFWRIWKDWHSPQPPPEMGDL